MAQPHKKGPIRTVDVFCANCSYLLYKYRKGGKGSLVKCFKERIVKDQSDGSGVCPQCQTQFARETLIRGAPAMKIIGGKVTSR